VNGKIEMTLQQVRAAEILLKKTLPDLQAIQHGLQDGAAGKLGSEANGIKLSSNTLLYQCFAYRSASLGSPQASLGQRVTAWDSSYFDRAARRLPWGRIPSNYLQEKGFRLT
jgi:hypothetical protein